MTVLTRCLTLFYFALSASAVFYTSSGTDAATTTDLSKSGPSSRRHYAATAENERLAVGDPPPTQPSVQVPEHLRPLNAASDEPAHWTFDDIVRHVPYSLNHNGTSRANAGVIRHHRHGRRCQTDGRRHQATNASLNDAVLWCHYCNHTCTAEKGLKRHYNDVHDEQVLRCSDCTVVFPRRERFNKHKCRGHRSLLAGKGSGAVSRQQSRHAHACGLCNAVFIQSFDRFFKHHVRHCKKHAQRRQWNVNLQLINLLGQDGLLDFWQEISRRSRSEADNFRQWCLSSDDGLLARLEGSWTHTLEGYLGDINNLLRDLLFRFTAAPITQQSQAYGYSNSSWRASNTSTEQVLNTKDHDRLSLATGATARLPDPLARFETFGGFDIGAQYPAHNLSDAQEPQDVFGLCYSALQSVMRNSVQQSQPYVANPPSGLWLSSEGHVSSGQSYSSGLPDGVDQELFHYESNNTRKSRASGGRITSQPTTSRQFTAWTDAHQRLAATIEAGIVPALTSGEDLLCGMHAVMGSINDLMRRGATQERPYRPLNVTTTMRLMFSGDIPTRAYSDFLELRLRRAGLVPGDGQYEQVRAEFTRVQNIGIEQLVAVPHFLQAQGLIDREIAIGVVSAGGVDSDGFRFEATVQLPDNTRSDVVWIHNDNAERLYGGIGHWSMFREGGNLPRLVDWAVSRSSPDGTDNSMLPGMDGKSLEFDMEEEADKFIGDISREDFGSFMGGGYIPVGKTARLTNVVQDAQVVQAGSCFSASSFEEQTDIMQDVQFATNGTLRSLLGTHGSGDPNSVLSPPAVVPGPTRDVYDPVSPTGSPSTLLHRPSLGDNLSESTLVEELDVPSPFELLEDMFCMQPEGGYSADA